MSVRLCSNCSKEGLCGDCKVSIKGEVCPICGKSKKPDRKTCGASCGAKLVYLRNGSPFSKSEVREKSKKTLLARYGAENIWGSDKGKESIRQSNLKKYGVESVLSLDKIKEKAKQTNLEKYGVEYASQSESFKEKVSKTCLEKYGKSSYLGSDAYYSTLEQRYGVNNIAKTPFVREKLKQAWESKSSIEKTKIFQKTVLTKKILYGKSAYLIKIDRIIKKYGSLNEYYKYRQHKIEESNLKKYGVKNVWELPEIKNKIFERHNYLKSSGETELKSFLDLHQIDSRKSRKELNGREIDFLVGKLAIEFNGDFWHSDLYKSKEYHQKKSIDCEIQGIQLIHVYEHLWRDPSSREKLESLILEASSHLNTLEKDVFNYREITEESAKKFYEDNSLETFHANMRYFGAFEKGQLVQVAIVESSSEILSLAKKLFVCQAKFDGLILFILSFYQVDSIGCLVNFNYSSPRYLIGNLKFSNEILSQPDKIVLLMKDGTELRIYGAGYKHCIIFRG